MAATVLFFKLIRATFYVESDSADNIFEGNAVLDIFASQFFLSCGYFTWLVGARHFEFGDASRLIFEKNIFC